MKKQDVTKNVIVELDFDELNINIREVDKYGKLLGNHGHLTDDYTYIDDKIILHRFAYLKGTIDAIDLLANILGSIDYSLKYTYYLTYKGKCIDCKGIIPADINEFDCTYIKPLICIDENNKPEFSEDEQTEIINIVYEHRNEILLEANKMKKYYKEYYTRLFDRGRTVK